MKNQIGTSQELICFQINADICFHTVPPRLAVYVNNECKFDQTLDKSSAVIEFDHLLNFDQIYQLRLVRQGKTDQDPAQMLVIKNIFIDGINVQNLIWAGSQYQPDYPMIWYQQQVSQNKTPEKTVVGETWLGHNGVWTMSFTSPFWRHLMEVMA
jgi:hypothetical protein